MASGTATYSLGPGGDTNLANVTRPIFIDIAFEDTSQDPVLEFQIKRLTEADWQAISMKDQESTYPQAYYWNPTFSLGSVTFWPVPTSATLRGLLYHWANLATFPTLDATLTLAPGYQRMLMTQIALELCSSYSAQPSPALVQSAERYMSAVKRVNVREADLAFEPAALIQGPGVARYNIREG